MDIADTYRVKLDMTDASVEIYKELMRFEPDLTTPYIKLLEIYLERKKFKDAIALIERFVEIDTDNFRLSSLYYTLGVLYKDHTSDISRAVECFNQSLDLDSNRLEAFSAIEELVASIGDVEAQIANYVRMIDRLKDGDKPAVLYKLYLNLGKLYLTVLYDKDDAREAFAAAAEVKPEEKEPLEYLLEISEEEDEKAQIYEKFLAVAPTNREALKFLRVYYTKTKWYDRVWNICGAVKVLGVADEKETKFFDAYLPTTLKIRKKLLASEVIGRDLLPVGTDLGIGGVINQMIQIVGARIADKSVRDRKYKILGGFKPADNRNVAVVFDLLRQVLGLGAFPIMISDGDFFAAKEDMRNPTLVLGRKLLTEASIKRIGFVAGKYLFAMKEEFLPWNLFGVNDLKTLMLAAIFHFYPKLKVDKGRESIIALSKYIGDHEDEKAITALKQHVEKYLSADAPIDIIGWNGNVELAANRFGLTISNDVELAIRIIKQDGIKSYKLSPEESIKDLLAFMVSPGYSGLKQVIGTYTTIGTEK